MGRKGMRKRAPLAANQARTRMWQSMRILRRFTSGDLQATAEVGASHSQKYVRMLLQAGYLRVVQAKQSGVTGGHAVYQLIRDTGPHAPRFGNEELRDPNLQPHELTPEEQPVTITRAEYERAMICTRACTGMADPEAEIERLRAAVQS